MSAPLADSDRQADYTMQTDRQSAANLGAASRPQVEATSSLHSYTLLHE